MPSSKWLRAAASTAAVAVVITACSKTNATSTGSGSNGGSGSGKKGPYTIGVSVADQKSLFYIAAVDGMRKKAAETGDKLIVLSADNNSTQQVNQVNNLLTQHIDALIFIAQDATSALAGTRTANKAGVPVIAVDEKPESGDAKLATFIATDSVKAADNLCTWLFQQMGSQTQLGILQGVLGATAEVQRSKGCQQALDKNPNIKVVAKQSAGWDETQAYKAAQNMLQANPGMAAVFGESDAMSLGAGKAARDAGKKIISVGIDGFPTMIQAIKDGVTQATEAQQPYKMGQIAVQDSDLILGGQGSQVPQTQYQDTTLVTSQNVNSIDPTQFYGPNAK